MRILTATQRVFAQSTNTGGGGNVNLPNPLGTNSIVNVVGSITGWLITVATPIVAVMVIVGAFQMLFAGGSEEKFQP